MINILLSIILILGIVYVYYYKEGMIFLQNKDKNDINKNNLIGGIKDHKYFKYYHWIFPLIILLVILTGIILYQIIPNIEINYLFLVLVLIVGGNEVAELAYSRARYDVFIPLIENFVFLNRYFYGDDVVTLHFLRCALILIFLVLGIFL